MRGDYDGAIRRLVVTKLVCYGIFTNNVLLTIIYHRGVIGHDNGHWLEVCVSLYSKTPL